MLKVFYDATYTLHQKLLHYFFLLKIHWMQVESKAPFHSNFTLKVLNRA